jgi:hypothetical protein
MSSSHATSSISSICVVGEAALSADRADAIPAPERLGEAHHACARRRADADLLVAALAHFAHVRRRVQEERAVQVHGRLLALVEDADLRAVADADDVALHGDLVARSELEDLLRVGDRKRDCMTRHQNSRS